MRKVTDEEAKVGVDSLFSSSYSTYDETMPVLSLTLSQLDSSASEGGRGHNKNLNLSQESTELADTKSPEASKTEETSNSLKANNMTSNSMAAAENSEQFPKTRKFLSNEGEKDVPQNQKAKKPRIQHKATSSAEPRTKRRKKSEDNNKGEKTRAKRGRPRKSPEQKKVKIKPIKGSNPYNYYVKKMRPQFMTENPDKSFKEVSDILGRNWRNLSSEQEYQIRLEMEEYVKNQNKVIDLTKDDDNKVEAEIKDNSYNQTLPEKSQQSEVIEIGQDKAQVEIIDNKLKSPRQVDVRKVNQLLSKFGIELEPKKVETNSKLPTSSKFPSFANSHSRVMIKYS